MPDFASRRRDVQRVLWLTLVGNYAVAAVKLGYAHMTGTLAFSADGVHSLLDGTANIVGLVGIGAAATPADEGHPYGHQRYEALAALAIGGLIVAGLYSIVSRVVVTMLAGHAVTPEWDALGVAGVTFAFNLGISAYERRRGRQLRSAVLIADASHTASDAIATLSIAGAVVAAHLGVPLADPIAALVIAVIVARTAWLVVKENIDVLSDARRIDPERVHDIAKSVDGIRGAHKARSRGTLDHVAVDLHIQVDPEMSVRDAHRLTHAVADAIRERLSDVHDVVIHTEPHDPEKHRRA